MVLLRKMPGKDDVRREVVRIENEYQPFDFQRGLHLAPHRVRSAITGARAGKTECGAEDAIDCAIDQPGMWQVDIDTGKDYCMGIGAPTFPMIERAILPAMLRKIPKALIVKPYNQTKHELILQGRNGRTMIYFISAKNPESWQGSELYYVWLDECPLMKESMYDEARTRLSSRRGRILLTGTPRGPNWVKKRIFDFSQTEAGRDIFFTTWTTEDNPYFLKEEIEYARRTMPPKYFKRTFLASWDVFEGQIYEEFATATHEASPRKFTFRLPSGRVVGDGPREVWLDHVFAGKDWGFGHKGAFVVCGRSRDGHFYVLDEIVEDHLLVAARTPDQDSWIKRIRVLKAKWEIEAVYCGPDRPENIQILDEAGLNAEGALDDVWEGIQEVSKLMHVDQLSGESRLTVLSNCRRVLEEAVFYHWRIDSVTGESSEKPEKIDDDAIDALRYALYTFIVRGSFVREPNYQP